jgi:hypothetical protein
MTQLLVMTFNFILIIELCILLRVYQPIYVETSVRKNNMQFSDEHLLFYPEINVRGVLSR